MELADGEWAGVQLVVGALISLIQALLREAILDGWLACAPSTLVESYLKSRRKG